MRQLAQDLRTRPFGSRKRDLNASLRLVDVVQIDVPRAFRCAFLPATQVHNLPYLRHPQAGAQILLDLGLIYIERLPPLLIQSAYENWL